MGDWLTKSFQEFSILWLLLSSILGGIIGASFKFIFESLLPDRLKQKSEILAVKRKYSTPILLAAEELRRRLENMITLIDQIEAEDWLPSSQPFGYYYLSSIYTVARFIAWQQILRREVVYLDFTTTQETRVFELFMRAIRRAFSDPALLNESHDSAPEESDDKWIYTFWFQGIGDWMIVEKEGKCSAMNYGTFVKKLKEHGDSERKQWLNSLGNLFTDLKSTDKKFRRIVAMHALINAFVNYTDPKHLRTEEQQYHWNLLKPEEAERIRKIILAISPDEVLDS